MDIRLRSTALTAAAALIVLGLTACSRHPSPSAELVPITLEDYRITSPVATTTAGLVSFDIQNRGPSTHEFVVFETDRPPDQMPIGADGLSIDEESPLLRSAGEIAEVDIGRSESLSLHLPAGRYVLACNMAGHYLGGMYLVLAVH